MPTFKLADTVVELKASGVEAFNAKINQAKQNLEDFGRGGVLGSSAIASAFAKATAWATLLTLGIKKVREELEFMANQFTETTRRLGNFADRVSRAEFLNRPEVQRVNEAANPRAQLRDEIAAAQRRLRQAEEDRANAFIDVGGIASGFLSRSTGGLFPTVSLPIQARSNETIAAIEARAQAANDQLSALTALSSELQGGERFRGRGDPREGAGSAGFESVADTFRRIQEAALKDATEADRVKREEAQLETLREILKAIQDRLQPFFAS